jgi:hypothetical protein
VVGCFQTVWIGLKSTSINSKQTRVGVFVINIALGGKICGIFEKLKSTPNKLVFTHFQPSNWRYVIFSILSGLFFYFLFFAINLIWISSTLTCEQACSGLEKTCVQSRKQVCQRTSHQQLVFATSHCLSQVVNKFGTSCLTTCNNLVDIIRLVARLFQQVRYSHDITILLQPCVVNLVTFLLYHDCIRLVRTTL